MKTGKLFLGLFAIAAICGCNTIIDPDRTDVEGEDAYMAVSIVAPGDVASRAGVEGDYDAGEDNENKVSSALFLFYMAEDFNQLAKPELKYNDNEGTNPYKSVVTDATIVLKDLHKDEHDNLSLLVVLNPPVDLETQAATLTLTQMKEVVGNYAAIAPGSFIMTNSTYTVDGKCEVACAGKIYNNAKNAIANPLEVYVERVVAKVSVEDTGWKFKDNEGTEVTEVTLDINQDIDTNGDISYDPATLTVKPVIKGYKVTNLAEDSYLFKNVEGMTAEWMDETNKRSYWATSPSENTFTLFSYEQIAAEPGRVFYCNENTSTTSSQLIVAVQFVDDSQNPVTFYRYQTEFYDETGIKNVALKLLKDAGYGTYTVGDLVFAASSAHDWTAVLKFADENGKSAGAKSLLAGMSEIMAWNNGMAYYYTTVDHFNDKVGLVRNHSYQIDVNSIKGLGTPVYDPSKPISPEKPTEDQYDNLAARVSILQWKVVTQEVDFGE